MLDIVIPAQEYYDEETNTFLYTKETALRMEHSLISISKWESKWHRAFLTKKERTPEETLDYFRCMIVNQVDSHVVDRLTSDNINDIIDYINEPMTAVYIPKFMKEDGSDSRLRDVTTSELLYYYMISLRIPFECERWHLNRLLALIHVCEIKNTPPKKMNKAAIARRNSRLNAARRKKYNTSG